MIASGVVVDVMGLFQEIIDTGRAARDGLITPNRANAMAKSACVGLSYLKFQVRHGAVPVPPLPAPPVSVTPTPAEARPIDPMVVPARKKK